MHVHRLVVDVVLDRLLARREGGVDLILLGLLGGVCELGLELRLERAARTSGNKKRGTDESRLQSV